LTSELDEVFDLRFLKCITHWEPKGDLWVTHFNEPFYDILVGVIR